MKIDIDMGRAGPQGAGEPALLDLEELLATRLLVQGNSGSGKSHLLRRLLEQSAPHVQQVVIDPEGDFLSLAERFGHVVIDADRGPAELEIIATRVRQHRVSAVLSLEKPGCGRPDAGRSLVPQQPFRGRAGPLVPAARGGR